jgi:hypothetical protein
MKNDPQYQEFQTWHKEAVQEAERQKDSQHVIQELERLYQDSTQLKKQSIEAVLRYWIHDGDSQEFFTAMVFCIDHRRVDFIPSLQLRLRKVADMHDIINVNDRKWVEQTIEKLKTCRH